ncbi:MAG: hypothetical protein AAGK78_10840 [Planctomycetota bacterium]
MSGVATLEPPLARPAPGGPPDEPIEPIDDFDEGGDDDGDEPQHEGVDWTTLSVFWSITEAHMARLKLEDAGMPCLLLDELTCGTGCLAIAAGGVKLQVPRALLFDAALVLSSRADGAVEVASFTNEHAATMAACVIEAQRVECAIHAEDETFAVEVAAGDATLAATALRGTRFGPAVEPWIEGQPTVCGCQNGLRPEDLTPAARRRWVTQRVWHWIDRHLPTMLRPARCLACGGERATRVKP